MQATERADAAAGALSAHRSSSIHTSMAFAMALRTDKRLKMIDGAGKEEYEQAETLDTSYLALLDPNRVPPAGDGEAKEEKVRMLYVPTGLAMRAWMWNGVLG